MEREEERESKLLATSITKRRGKSRTELEGEPARLTCKQKQRNPKTGASTVSLVRRSQRG